MSLRPALDIRAIKCADGLEALTLLMLDGQWIRLARRVVDDRLVAYTQAVGNFLCRHVCHCPLRAFGL